MANKPPKHPSAANMGMCVRTYNDGVYHDIDPALSAGGVKPLSCVRYASEIRKS